MKEERVIKVRTYNRRPGQERRSCDEIFSACGLPWKPTPEASGVEVKSHFRDREEEEKIMPLPNTRDNIPRNVFVCKDDVSKERYGVTIGFHEGEGANRGITGIHNGTCRERMDSAISEKGIDRLENVVMKLSSHDMRKFDETKEADSPPPGPIEENLTVKGKIPQEGGSYSVGPSSGPGETRQSSITDIEMGGEAISESAGPVEKGERDDGNNCRT